MNRNSIGWIVLILANLMVWCMLVFQGRIGAAPQEVRAPFDNAVQQRNDMIRELQEIKNLLKEQNGLMRGANTRSNASDRKTRP